MVENGFLLYLQVLSVAVYWGVCWLGSWCLCICMHSSTGSMHNFGNSADSEGPPGSAQQHKPDLLSSKPTAAVACTTTSTCLQACMVLLQ